MGRLTTWFNLYRAKQYQKNRLKCNPHVSIACTTILTWISSDCSSGYVQVGENFEHTNIGSQYVTRFHLPTMEVSFSEFCPYEEFSILSHKMITLFHSASNTSVELSKVDKKCLKFVLRCYKNWLKNN